MRKYNLIIIILLLLPWMGWGNNPNEIIRQKIETAHIKGLTAFGEPVYCIQTLPQFYLNNSFNAVWNTNMAHELKSAIIKAEEEGLNPNDYHLIKINEALNNTAQSAIFTAELDLLLTDAFLLYSSHLLSGKVNPKTIDSEWHVSRREGNPVELLTLAISTGQIKSTLQSAAPHQAAYKKLKNTLKTYRSLKDASWTIISEGETLKKGMQSERVPLIRERLKILGDLKDLRDATSVFYDDDLFNAVQKFQARHGLDNDGEIGSKTIGALNLTPSDRILQIEANLERWRWLPQEFGDFYILVNIASFELNVFKNQEVLRTHKIISGKPFRQTPVFSSKMSYLVLNPTWTIPPGILRGDVIPGIRKDPQYLAKKKLQVLDQSGNMLNPAEIDWNSKAPYGYTYRQPSGPENALGAVKFMFPNSFHVYLHDTPSKELFDKSERAFSSGCIRVKDPLELAEFLINDPIKWNREKINKVVESRQITTVQLNEQPNVHLLYWTVIIDAENTVQFRKDIYERDQLLIKELKEKAPIK